MRSEVSSTAILVVGGILVGKLAMLIRALKVLPYHRQPVAAVALLTLLMMLIA